MKVVDILNESNYLINMSYLNNTLKNFFTKSLKDSDPDLDDSISKELERQKSHLELIASRKYCFKF